MMSFLDYRDVKSAAFFVAVIVAVVLSAFVLTRPPVPEAIRRSSAAPPPTAIERGRLVYLRYGCSLCHGDDANSGIPSPNAETNGIVPPAIYVQEGYTKPELRNYLRKGNQKIGREEADGPAPPWRMPGGLGRMSRDEASDLTEYLWSLFPEDKKSEKW
jgi:mono/diheme cytochrome c family protein